MKKFSKSEIISLAVIFLVLIVISWPNFKLSLRRARDQVRRDDIGNIQAAIDNYYLDYGMYPATLADSKLLKYTKTIARDPNLSKGASYVYFSDGSRYQLFASLEGGSDEPGFDAKLASRNVSCGINICNIGRATNVPLYITIEEYDFQIYCGQHPRDIKCIKK